MQAWEGATILGKLIGSQWHGETCSKAQGAQDKQKIFFYES